MCCTFDNKTDIQWYPKFSLPPLISQDGNWLHGYLLDCMLPQYDNKFLKNYVYVGCFCAKYQLVMLLMVIRNVKKISSYYHYQNGFCVF